MTRPELYFYTWDQLIDGELHRVVGDLRAFLGSTSKTVDALRKQAWHDSDVERYLRSECQPALPGRTIVSLSIDDLLSTTYTQIRMVIKTSIAMNLDRFGSNRAAAEFLGINDKYLSGLKDR